MANWFAGRQITGVATLALSWCTAKQAAAVTAIATYFAVRTSKREPGHIMVKMEALFRPMH